MIKLKNYTSGVPVSRTVSRIEEILAVAGAKAIGKDYENGKLSSVTFQMVMNRRDFLIRLPANPRAVYESMKKEVKRPHAGTLDRLQEQADRTAWKIQLDWLEIELTKLRLNQTEPLQAFLPYIWDGHQTYFHALKEKGFKAMLTDKSQS